MLLAPPLVCLQNASQMDEECGGRGAGKDEEKRNTDANDEHARGRRYSVGAISLSAASSRGAAQEAVGRAAGDEMNHGEEAERR
jgi:hypothetical protein